MARPFFTALLFAGLCIGRSCDVMAQLFVGDQGSTRSVSTTAASLTMTNGAPGFIAATTQRPFVTSFVPVVGGYGGGFAPVYGPAALMPSYAPGPSVLAERLARMKQEGISLRPSGGKGGLAGARQGLERNELQTDENRSRLTLARESSAGQPLESVATIRRRQAREDESRTHEINDLRHKIQEAQEAGKSSLVRVYEKQLESRTGQGEASSSSGALSDR